MFNPTKAAYNVALAAARKSLATALGLRKALVSEDPALKGSSVASLEAALEASFKARTFDGYEGDLAKEENPYRARRGAVAGRRA